MTAGRFTLVFVGLEEGMDEPTLAYVTSWDTWDEARAAFQNGRIPTGYRLYDNETGRVWHTAARYEWEDAQT